MVSPPQPSLQAGILQFHFIKSALTVNPCTVRGSVETYCHTHTKTCCRIKHSCSACSPLCCTEQPGAGVAPWWRPPLPDLWRPDADPQHLWRTPAHTHAPTRRQPAAPAPQPRLPSLSGTQHFTGTQALACGPGKGLCTTPTDSQHWRRRLSFTEAENLFTNFTRKPIFKKWYITSR